MRAGRDEAFHDFVVSTRGDLLRTATLLAAGDRHLAEDLVQVSLTRLYVAWGRLREPAARHAYARRILVNSLIDETRRPWRRREQPRAELPDRADLTRGRRAIVRRRMRRGGVTGLVVAGAIAGAFAVVGPSGPATTTATGGVDTTLAPARSSSSTTPASSWPATPSTRCPRAGRCWAPTSTR